MITDEIIVAGNGPSLLVHPESFLTSRPLFAMNYFPYYAKIKPTYWTAWDALCIEDNFKKLGDETEVILHPRLKGWMLKQRHLRPWPGNVSFWANNVRVPGLGWSEDAGVYYTSSLHWAISISANLLKFRRIFVVGFDCTIGRGGSYRGLGKGKGAHFYDKEGGGHQEYAEKWDRQLLDLRIHLWSAGFDVINITPGSYSILNPPEDWRKYAL